MRLTAVYPQTELDGDPDAVGRFATTAEDLGYDTVLFYDHVVGAEHANREPPLWGPYTETDPFHDPFVAFGYLAAVTTRVELATGVLIMPQRQTVLVAQQAADVDLLSGGRLRLGVGTGWNWVEYDALGQDFATRGRRLDEQVELLRRLWREPLLSFEGEFDRIERGCINPRPRRDIPIWMGGFSEPAFRRAARLGDGFRFAGSLEHALEGRMRLSNLLADQGRHDMDFGYEFLPMRVRTTADIAEQGRRWRDAGGTDYAVVTMRLGLEGLDAHLDHLASAIAALRD